MSSSSDDRPDDPPDDPPDDSPTGEEGDPAASEDADPSPTEEGGQPSSGEDASPSPEESGSPVSREAEDPTGREEDPTGSAARGPSTAEEEDPATPGEGGAPLPDLSWLGAILGLALVAAAGDLLLDHAPEHAVLVGLLVLAVPAATWRVTGRVDLAVWSALFVTAWGLPYAATQRTLLAATGVTGLLLLRPPKVLLEARLLIALATGALAGALALVLLRSELAGGIAFVLATLGGFVRPVRPTTELRRGLQTGALALPAAALFGLLALNAATERLEIFTVRGSLGTGISLLALLWMVAIAGLGLVTLLESQSRHQAGAWLTSVAGAAVVLASVVLKDPSVSISLVVITAGPLVVLGCLALARLQTSIRPRWPWVLPQYLLLVLPQWLLP